MSRLTRFNDYNIVESKNNLHHLTKVKLSNDIIDQDYTTLLVFHSKEYSYNITHEFWSKFQFFMEPTTDNDDTEYNPYLITEILLAVSSQVVEFKDNILRYVFTMYLLSIEYHNKYYSTDDILIKEYELEITNIKNYIYLSITSGGKSQALIYKHVQSTIMDITGCTIDVVKARSKKIKKLIIQEFYKYN